MEKKRIVIVSMGMDIGGAERALLGLLSSLDYKRVDVDLFLFHKSGPLLKYIPKEVNLLAEKVGYSCLGFPIKNTIKKLQFGVLVGRIYAKLKAKHFLNDNNIVADNAVELFYSHKYTIPFLPKINNETYDLAISFLAPHCAVLSKVKAKIKVAWIHTDYKTLEIDCKKEYRVWSKYDFIMSISDKCSESFLYRFPKLKNKIIRMDNINNTEQISKQANEIQVEDEYRSEEGVIKILSVGRFDYAKNFDSIPEIASYLKNAGISFKWYIIGFGSEESKIRNNINEFGMEHDILLLGKKENPYPYMKSCDIYIQPSRYEGNCVSVHEAQILGKPVIITSYETANSQLIDGQDGIIVPMDNKLCGESIVRLIKEKILLEKVANYCNSHSMDNSSEIEKIYELLEK